MPDQTPYSIALTMAAALAVAPLGTAGCGMDLVLIQAEAQEVCLTDVIVDLDAAGGEAYVRSAVRESLDFDLPDDLTADINLLGIDIQPYDNVDDFSFIDRVRIDLDTGDPGDDIEPITLIDYQRGPSDSANISVAGNALANLVDYVTAETIELDIEFRGAMPEKDWSVRLDACFDMSGAYRHQPIPE